MSGLQWVVDGYTVPFAALLISAGAVSDRLGARPMVPLAVFRSPAVVACAVTGFSINTAFYGVAFVLSLYFQRILGEPPVTAGLLFLPMTGLLTLANLVSARVAARWGHHVPVRAVFRRRASGLSPQGASRAQLAVVAEVG